jgi:hypothetical protein
MTQNKILTIAQYESRLDLKLLSETFVTCNMDGVQKKGSKVAAPRLFSKIPFFPPF